METSQVKVNGDTAKETTPAGLQPYSDEQLAAEMRRRGYEVWKWDDWDWE